MKKFLLGVLGAALVLPFAASAATIPATAVFNGQTQVWGNAGQTVQVTLRVNASAGEVVHAIQTDVLGDNLATVCQDIGNFEGAQNKDVTLSVTLPPNTGDYGFQAVVYTAPNTAAANALTGDAACAPSAGNTAGPAFNQSNVIHVIPSGSTTSTGGSTTPTEDPVITALKAQIASLTQLVQQLLAANAPKPTPTKCQAFVTASTDVSGLQHFLLANGESIPALSNGAAFGFYGPQTTAAVSHFKLVNSCN